MSTFLRTHHEDLSKKNGYDPDELKHAKDLDNYYNA